MIIIIHFIISATLIPLSIKLRLWLLFLLLLLPHECPVLSVAVLVVAVVQRLLLCFDFPLFSGYTCTPISISVFISSRISVVISGGRGMGRFVHFNRFLLAKRKLLVLFLMMHRFLLRCLLLGFTSFLNLFNS